MKIEINILQYKEYSSELTIMSGTATERSSSSAESSNAPQRGSMTIDIRPMIEDVSQVMTKHITNILSGVIGEYTVYKETHDTIMGLPCVRRLQERILELEQNGSTTGNAAAAANDNRRASASSNREDEIAQLQSAIAELNRYIHALESRVDMKTTMAESETTTKQKLDGEESVKLEIHETALSDEECHEDSHEPPCVVSSTHKNVIVTAEALIEEEEEEADEAEAEEEEVDEEAEAEDAVASEHNEETAVDNEEEEEEEEEEKQEDAEQEEGGAADEEPAEEEEEGGDAIEEEETAVEEEEEQEDAEEEAEEEPEEAPAAEEDAEIEVSEVKIKGKTYFTTDPQNGIIYACVDDDVGDEVGVFKNGVAVFNKGKK